MASVSIKCANPNNGRTTGRVIHSFHRFGHQFYTVELDNPELYWRNTASVNRTSTVEVPDTSVSLAIIHPFDRGNNC